MLGILMKDGKLKDGDRMIVDTEKLKDVKLYEQYTKTVSVAPGIRVKFS